MSSENERPPESVSRADLEEALGFVTAMAMQGQNQLDRIDAILAALIRVLLDTGRLDRRRVEALLPEATRQVTERAKNEITVDVGSSEDKYKVESPADLDCAALMPLCKGRCCRLTFALSFQDLEEGVVQWSYSTPYRIRQGDDGYCVHSEAESRRCGVYDKRPSVCRTYDCREDKRIWTDFERRIPAPESAVRPRPRLYGIRRPPPDGASRMDEPDEE